MSTGPEPLGQPSPSTLSHSSSGHGQLGHGNVGRGLRPAGLPGRRQGGTEEATMRSGLPQSFLFLICK